MKQIIIVILISITGFPVFSQIFSQTDTSHFQDTSKILMHQDAIYNRPFIYLSKAPMAIGGYLEGNTNYFATDGVTEGFSMEMKRFTIFLYSKIADRIKLLSEIEFEHGAEEIEFEFAAVDFELHPSFNFRGGIIMAPIGAFNVNHDGPKWEFIERPLMATQIVPSTLSDIGFGIHGQLYGNNTVFSYDLFLVNGLRDGIILNSEGKTFLQGGKSDEMFAEDNNGVPMYTGRMAVKHSKIGELGFSYYGGIYNTYQMEGNTIDQKRNLSIFDLDFNTKIKKVSVSSEIAYNLIEIPTLLSELYGNKQWGGYIDIVYPILKRKIFSYENTVLNLNMRLEAIDYNIGQMTVTGAKIYDEMKAIVPGISIRPSGSTVIRANYRYHWQWDFLGNPPSRTAGFQFGISSYF